MCQTFVKHDPKQGKWIRNRKTSVYVALKIKNRWWAGGVDEMYLGAHLINTNKGPKKKK